MINVGIIGATSYIGIEIIRLLQNHPNVNISVVISQGHVGQRISTIYQNLNTVFDKDLEYLNIEKIIDKADVFFTCIPHRISKVVIPILFEHGKKIIDFSGNFLFNSHILYEKWTNSKHEMPYLLPSSAFGLPEIYADKIKTSSIIGIPSAFSTTSVLSLAPLLKPSLIDLSSIIININSAISEEGRNNDMSYQFCEVSENLRLQKYPNINTKIEIAKELTILADEEPDITLFNFISPVKRGQLSTIFTTLKENITETDIFNLYKEYYKKDHFIRIIENNKIPETKWVIGSNFLDLSIILEKKSNKIIILSAIDNLIKGAAGQAVQCFNLLYGFHQELSLSSAGFYL